MKMMKRVDILAALAGRDHANYHDRYLLSWNVKVYSFDDSGIIPHYYPNDPRFNEQWDEYKNDRGDGLWELAAQCWWDDLDLILEGHPDRSLDGIGFEFVQFGRMGGWAGLKEFDGWKLEHLHSWDEIPYPTLWALYKFVLEVDAYVNDRHNHLAYTYADQREQLEMEWQGEIDAEEAQRLEIEAEEAAQMYEDAAREEEFFGAL